MTIPQIAALAALAVTILAVYGRPLLNGLTRPKPSVGLLDHVRDVIAIREYYHTPEVERACNGLLEVLIGVSKK